MDELFRILADRIKQNKATVLLTIIRTRGATPGRTGFKMLVGNEGRIYGTAGGGAVEFHAINKCSELIKGTTRHYNETIQLIDENIKKGTDPETFTTQNSALVIDPHRGAALESEVVAVDATIVKIDTPAGESSSIPNNASTKSSGKTKIVLPAWCGGEVELFYELYSNDKILYIFGAGHVGSATAELASRQGFFVEIFDDRKDILDALPENIYSKKNLVQYPPAEFHTDLNPNGYVIILTQSHRHDLPVLDYLINNHPELKYIGMIGSTLKVKECILSLKKKYGNKFSFDNLYAPIGIEIGGTTPAEISVAIIAEIFSIIYGKEVCHMRLNYKEINP